MPTTLSVMPFELRVTSYYNNGRLGLGCACTARISLDCPEELAKQAVLFYFRSNQVPHQILYTLTEDVAVDNKNRLTFTVVDDSWFLVESLVSDVKKYIKDAIRQYRLGILETPPEEYVEEL